MIKRKWLFPVVAITIIALLGISVVAGRAVYNYMFPMAAPIDCPDVESITSVTLIQDNTASVTVEITDAGEFLRNISNAQPTRIWSVNDYPVEKSYYTIEIDTIEREYRYFVYVENSQVYVESPYEGVYQANQQILDLVVERFKD